MATASFAIREGSGRSLAGARRSAKRGFARISSAYASVASAATRRETRELAIWLRPHAGECVLDAACGPGGLAHALARQAARVCALDLCPQMLHRARQAGGVAARLLLTAGDVRRLPFPSRTFHLVTCSYAFANLRHPLAVLREYARVVRRDGRIAVVDVIAPENHAQRQSLNRLEYLRSGFHTRVRSRSQFLRLFTRAGLGIVEAPACRRRCRFRDWLRLSPAALDSARRARALRQMLVDSIDGNTAGLYPRLAGRDIIFYHTTAWFMLRRKSRRASAPAQPRAFREGG